MYMKKLAWGFIIRFNFLLEYQKKIIVLMFIVIFLLGLPKMFEITKLWTKKKKQTNKCDTLYKNSKVLTFLAYIWLFIEKIAQHITNIEHQ